MFQRLTCNRCGTEFSTDREPPIPGGDTSRCPSCGTQHTTTSGAGASGQAVAADGGLGVPLEIHAEDGATVVVNPSSTDEEETR